MGGIEIAHHRARGIGLTWTAMTQECSIAASDHGTGVAQERLDAMTRGRSLPFVAAEMRDVEKDFGDFLLRRASPFTVEGAEHSALTGALLTRQARVWWDGAAVQGGEKSVDGFDPVKAFDTEGDDGDRRPIDRAVDDLEPLSVPEGEAECCVIIANWRIVSPWLDRLTSGADAECRRGLRQDDDAGVLLREPEDGSIWRRGLGIDREIATPTAAGFVRSAVRGLHGQRPQLQNLRHRRRCGGAIPRPDRMRSTYPDGHIPKNARSMRRGSSRSPKFQPRKLGYLRFPLELNWGSQVEVNR